MVEESVEEKGMKIWMEEEEGRGRDGGGKGIENRVVEEAVEEKGMKKGWRRKREEGGLKLVEGGRSS